MRCNTRLHGPFPHLADPVIDLNMPLFSKAILKRLECPVDEDAGYVNDRWTNRDLIPIPPDRRTYRVWSFAVSLAHPGETARVLMLDLLVRLRILHLRILDRIISLGLWFDRSTEYGLCGHRRGHHWSTVGRIWYAW